MSKRSPVSTIAMVSAALLLVASEADAQNRGVFTWTDESGASDSSRPLEVFYQTPTSVLPTTPVWFVLHGASRNADDYRDYLGDAPAAAADALILAPRFTKEDWPGSRSYNLGNVSISESDRAARDETEWSFSKIEPLFDYVRTVFAPQLEAESYSAYGHSAGAQFLHRFLFWKPEARVKLAVAANAGWYTVPTTDGLNGEYPYEWPYTLDSPPDYRPATPALDPVPIENADVAFGKGLVVLLGEADTERTDSLRQTEEADAQGPHRFARGQFFYSATQDLADDRGTPFRWGLQTVPGVGHSGRQMAVPAAELMRAADAAVGDFNADGDIDHLDYTAWVTEYGGAALAPRVGADADGDARVDAADYALWREAVSGGEAPVAVPEPSEAALLGSLAVVVALAKKREGVPSVAGVDKLNRNRRANAVRGPID